MDEDRFNMEVSKFLKMVGITSQREIENVVRAAEAAGALKGKDKLAAKMTLSIPELGFSHGMDGSIEI